MENQSLYDWVWLDEWEHPENYSNPALLRNMASKGFRLGVPVQLL
jgi:hypothetical protein